MYYEEYGEGEPVFFLHGFTLDRRMWRPQIEFFKPYYRLIIPDARGHGLSDAPETGYGRGDRVEDLKRFADKLKIDRFHAVGLSMGGSTSIGLALDSPNRLKSMTLVSTGAAGYDIGKKISKIDRMARERGLETARQKWKIISLGWYGQGQEDIRELMETMINEYSGSAWTDARRGNYPKLNDMDKFDKIHLPTRIFSGKLDKIFCRLAGIIHNGIPGSTLSVFDDVGHMLNLEAPERFNEELKVFLEGVAGVR